MSMKFTLREKSIVFSEFAIEFEVDALSLSGIDE